MCFYNGTASQPDKKELRLSEAFDGEADIEVRVTMLNINYGKNKALMEACRPLHEYAWLIDAVRRHQQELKNPEAAVDAAINEMSEKFIIKKFLILNKAEVKGMFLTEYDQEKVLEQARREERREAFNDALKLVAANMLAENLPVSLIVKISKLSEDAVREIAESRGITII